jgi:hypothetical protein
MKDYILWAEKPKINLDLDELGLKELAKIISYCGSNSGNLIYVRGLQKILTTDTLFSNWNSFPNDSKNLIFPAANQLSKRTNLLDLKNAWQKYNKNIIVVSLGLQARLNEHNLNLTNGTQEWLKFLIKNTESKKSFISVRGNQTKDFIDKFNGGKVIAKVTGCPSQFISNPEEILDSVYEKIQKPLNTLTVNAAHWAWNFFYKYEKIFAEEICKNDGAYLVQAPVESIISVLLKKNDDKIISTEDLSLPLDMQNIDASNFFHNKSKFFIEVDNWMNFLKNYDYNIGCRIHGCMASFAAGIPSFLFVTDRRTQEFAETMNLPHTQDLSLSDPINYAKEKLKTHDFKSMIHKWRNNAKVFKELFDINEVDLNKDFLNSWVK